MKRPASVSETIALNCKHVSVDHVLQLWVTYSRSAANINKANEARYNAAKHDCTQGKRQGRIDMSEESREWKSTISGEGEGLSTSGCEKSECSAPHQDDEHGSHTGGSCFANRRVEYRDEVISSRTHERCADSGQYAVGESDADRPAEWAIEHDRRNHTPRNDCRSVVNFLCEMCRALEDSTRE